MDFIHPEFQDTLSAISETGFDVETGTYDEEMEGQDIDEDTDPFPPLAWQDEEKAYPTIYAVEGTFLSLIQQGFLGGFVVKNAESVARWAIAGAKQRGGALPAGFPVVYTAVIDRAGAVGSGGVDQIPGWVKDEQLTKMAGGPGALMAGGSMAGRVVRLSNVRPVGGFS